MSFQVQKQQQQSGQVYPDTFTRPPASPSHHSNGSFVGVFIVLAIIVFVSAIACFLGRLCSNKCQKQRNPKQQNHKFRPKTQRDIEFGLDNRKMPPMPSAKVTADAGVGGVRGFKPHKNGEMKGFDEMNSRGFKAYDNSEIKGFHQMRQFEEEGYEQSAGA